MLPRILPHDEGRHPNHALSTTFVHNVNKAVRFCEGDGLYLEAQPTGTRSWIQRLSIHGKRRALGLGGFSLKGRQYGNQVVG